jgi:hypothetical protein
LNFQTFVLIFQIKILASGSAGYFKGFIVQARNSEDLDAPIGSFESESASHMTCGVGIHNSITHTDPKKETEIEAVWRPPTDFEGTVVFRHG